MSNGKKKSKKKGALASNARKAEVVIEGEEIKDAIITDFPGSHGRVIIVAEGYPGGPESAGGCCHGALIVF
jgi:hypothetical protein